MTFKRVSADEVNRATTVLRGAVGEIGECRPGADESWGKGDLHRPRRWRDRPVICRWKWIPRASPIAACRSRESRATCITAIDLEHHTATELVQEAAKMTGEEAEEVLRSCAGLLPETKMLILSGSLAPGVGEDFYAECCESAAKAPASP